MEQVQQQLRPAAAARGLHGLIDEGVDAPPKPQSRHYGSQARAQARAPAGSSVPTTEVEDAEVPESWLLEPDLVGLK